MIKLVLIDTRDASPTRGAINELFLGSERRLLVQVPPLVYHGWKCISPEMATVLNLPTEPYHYAEPDEYRLEPHGTLPYDWSRKDG
jgi:dTDP-4-dehydrorhamnose 3,5-epimerase